MPSLLPAIMMTILVASSNGSKNVSGSFITFLTVHPFVACAGAYRVFIGTSSLDAFNEMEPSQWPELSKRLSGRTQNINVVGALAVATAAVFLTTDAPDGVLLINWNRELPYFCLAACAGCGMLAVMSGLGVIVFLDGTDHESIKVSAILGYSILLLIPVAPANN
ncbi:hypothetical protein EDC04DRAFT_1491935 [Pisolithus marmoratus]|nr:hypothetical protein EDC04DRAFT_1491935 [Pisolithus marmoratus]